MFDITGVISFSNLVFICSILLIVGGFIWMFGLYFALIIILIPPLIIEFALYGGLTFAIYKIPAIFSPNTAFIWGLLFASGLSATTLLTGLRTNKGNLQLFNFVNMLIHAFTGVYLKSSLICSVSVMFFMSLIGFHMGFGQGFFVIGYTDKKSIPSGTVASGIVTIVGSLLKILLENELNTLHTISHTTSLTIHPFMQYAILFVPGMIWLGPFVFFLSLLITSSKLYCSRNYAFYVNYNLINIVLSVSAVLLGNLYGIQQLTGFSGTFFALYLTQKYIELMPNKTEIWALTSIILGAFLYIVNMHYRSEFEKYGLSEYFNLYPPVPN